MLARLVREIIWPLIHFADSEADSEEKPVWTESPIPAGVWPSVKLPEGAREYLDLLVAQTPQKDILLDLFLPAEAAGPLPVVVWVHGGGWTEGSRKDSVPYHLVGHDFAVAAISYRFSQESVFPAQLHDCKASIRWLRAHAAQYGLDPNRIGAWGASAGGHLVSLLGTTAGMPEFDGEVGGNLEFSSAVQAVCNFCGPVDLLMQDLPELRDRYASVLRYFYGLVGGPLDAHKELALQANPATHITGDEPPFLLVYGAVDDLIPTEQGKYLHEALVKAGVDSTFHIVPNGWHVFWGADIDEMVLRFFQTHLA